MTSQIGQIIKTSVTDHVTPVYISHFAARKHFGNFKEFKEIYLPLKTKDPCSFQSRSR